MTAFEANKDSYAEMEIFPNFGVNAEQGNKYQSIQLRMDICSKKIGCASPISQITINSGDTLRGTGWTLWKRQGDV